MTIFDAQRIHLTGIKGVAMTSLAQCLLDMGKVVTGTDTSEEFVTQPLLEKMGIPIEPITLDTEQQPLANIPLPELLIYTAAHGGPQNPEVKYAQQNQVTCLSHAEALSQLFNQKRGVAVCGVGGKSTTSAMLTWILTQLELNPAFSVGVGKIIGMEHTGRWDKVSEWFIAEADEYVTDPLAVQHGEEVTPRFSYMTPEVIVCTNISHDHPDVYPQLEDTLKSFKNFFMNLKTNGKLVVNQDDENCMKLANELQLERSDIQIFTFGESEQADFQLSSFAVEDRQTVSRIQTTDQEYPVKLSVPGKYNVKNALAALTACQAMMIEIDPAIEALTTFQSTLRRFEFKGKVDGAFFYDDYAHHPSEIIAVIQALNEWYPENKKIIAFQPHTYSRTKQLFTEFINSFSQAKHVVLLDIYASAREQADSSITSDMLATEIAKTYPNIELENVHTVENLAKWIKTNIKPKDVLITLGAGDIYKVYEEL